MMTMDSVDGNYGLHQWMATAMDSNDGQRKGQWWTKTKTMTMAMIDGNDNNGLQ